MCNGASESGFFVIRLLIQPPTIPHPLQLAQAKAIRQEAAADLEAAQMIRSRLSSAAPGPAPGSNPSDAASGPSPSNLSASQQQSGSGSGSDPSGTSLKSLMRLPHGGGGAARGERQLPKAPTRSVMAHKGGVCSLAVHGDGERAVCERLAVSCIAVSFPLGCSETCATHIPAGVPRKQVCRGDTHDHSFCDTTVSLRPAHSPELHECTPGSSQNLPTGLTLAGG